MRPQTLVPHYLKNLKVYEAGKPIEDLAREKGLCKISKLASNENPLGPSPNAVKEMEHGLWETHRYPDTGAYRLKSLLCNKYKLQSKNIILGNGSEGIMSNIVRAFLSENQEVLTSENTFIGFYILAKSVGAKLKLVPLNQHYQFDIKNIVKNITQKTKLIYIANPNNPTGTFIKKEEFDFMMEHVPEHVLVILDEAYFEFGVEHPDYPDSMDYRFDNVITLRTFSKAYGLSGVRIGYGFGHEDLIENLNKIKLPFEPNLLAQLAACGALSDTAHLQKTIANNKIQCIETIKFLKKHLFDPIESVTNFVTFKAGTARASQFLYDLLLNEGVIVRPLIAHDMPGYIRVSLGTPEEMQHFYLAMEKALPQFREKYTIL